MHLKSLKIFCDVVGRRSFSRAANENGITQSGASQIVHHLEEHLGVKLIDRSTRPFGLTQEGQVYYEGCRGLIQKFFALEEDVRTLHRDVEGRVGIASIYSVGLSHLNICVQGFLTDHPRANVRVEYQHPNRVRDLVETGQVDIGLISHPRQTRLLRAIPWREERMVFVCAPIHPLAGLERVSIRQLDGLDMVGFDSDLKVRREIDRVLTAHQVDVSTVMEFDNIETLKRAVEINVGFSLLPEPTISQEIQTGTLVSAPLADVTMVRPLGIIHRCGADLGTTARRFVNYLVEHPTWKAPSASRELPATEGVGGKTEA